jgi:thiamine biosynthesis protein ThiS
MRIQVNGQWQDQAGPLSVAELIAKLALDERRLAVEWNGDILPRARYAQTILADQDRLEIVTLVGGG